MEKPVSYFPRIRTAMPSVMEGRCSDASPEQKEYSQDAVLTITGWLLEGKNTIPAQNKPKPKRPPYKAGGRLQPAVR
jgi:hypothetical protein